MRKFTNFALAALATMTLVGVSAQDRHGDPDELDANSARGATARNSRHVESDDR